MTLPVFFVGDISSRHISFDESTSRHIVQVLRMKVGERVRITNGLGKWITAEMDQADKKGATAKVLAEDSIPKAALKTCIAISPIKNTGRFEWFLEKAGELGISDIVLLNCERTEKQHLRLDRMRSILLSAMLQSQQAWLTNLHDFVPFLTFVEENSFAQKYIAHCEEHADALPISRLHRLSDTVILIGPEGDFSGKEITEARKAGFNDLSLGNNRLRTETAGIVSAAFMACG